jgi:hypothetical protein
MFPGADSKSRVKPSLTKTRNFSLVAHVIGTSARLEPVTILEFKSQMYKSYWIMAQQWSSFRVEWPNVFMSRARRSIF